MKQSADWSSSRAHDERATQLRDETLAVVAHELRDPLQLISVLAIYAAARRPSSCTL